MKYNVVQLLTDPPQYRITGPNCQFDFGWDRSTVAHHVCGELNRLNGEVDVQVEAKCNALRKVTDLEALGVEMELKLKGTPTSRALKQRLDIRTGQVHELLTVLERAQTALALYIEPGAILKPKHVLTDLMGILDDGELVGMMRNLRELIGVKDNGSVELTKADKLAVLKALDELAGFLTKFTPMQPASYTEACRILGASEDGDVKDETEYLNSGANGERLRESIGLHKLMKGGTPHWATHYFQDGASNDWFYGKLVEGGYYIDSDSEATSSRVWTPLNIVAGTLREVSANGSKKFLEVGDEMIVTLTRGSDGKQYVSGFGLGVEQPFIVQGEQVFVNGACIEKSSVSAMELGTAIHEGLERVVNNTTNNFGPSEKLKRKNRKLKARVSELENERDELLSEIRADHERD